MNLIISLFLFTLSSFANECSINYDTLSYIHKDMSFDLFTPLEKIMSQKGYVYSQRNSPYRTNIKVRIQAEENKTYLRTFFNLYRYRTHLEHKYEYIVCEKEECSREEISGAINKMLSLVEDLDYSCH